MSDKLPLMICILSYVDDNDDDYVKYTLQLSWFTLPETRPGTRTFNHYPTRTRSKVKKCYSSCPSDVTWSKITASNSRREGEDTWLWAGFGGQGDFLRGSQLGEHQPGNNKKYYMVPFLLNCRELCDISHLLLILWPFKLISEMRNWKNIIFCFREYCVWAQHSL